MAIRLDFGTLGKYERTASGGVVVPASLTRAGVFTYMRNGQIVREYRPPSEVFKPESLATLRAAPVTNGHPNTPNRMVDPTTWKELSVGHVDGPAGQDGENVVAALAIQDAPTITAIADGSLCEISCGYHVDALEQPGVTPEGEAYDLIQTNIVFNHVALGPSGWGRAGETACLRLDAADAVQVTHQKEAKQMEYEWIEGVRYVVGSPEHVAAKAAQKVRTDSAAAELGTLNTKVKTLETQVTTLTGERDTLQGRCDAAEGEVKTLKETNAKLHRNEIERRAKAVLGSGYRADEKLDALAIMSEAIKKRRPDLKLEGKSPDYIAGVFESVLGTAGADDAPEGDGAPATDGLTPPGDKTAAVPPGGSEDPNAQTRTDSTDARERMVARNAAKFQVPGAKTK